MLVKSVPNQFRRGNPEASVPRTVEVAPTEGPVVPGYGNRNARILFVGEAPARKEVELGRPFQGKAGEQLNDLLRDAGIHRDDVYCTNASLRPVVGKDKDRFFFDHPKKGIPSVNMIEGMKALGNDLAEINPCVVVPLGNYALWAMMQHQGIMSWRGSVLWSELWQRKVVPTIHPAALLRNSGEPGSTEDGGGMWKMRPVVIWDLERALSQSQYPELRRTERNIIVNPTGELHDQCVARLLRSRRRIVDIESWGETKLACIGFSDGDPNWSVTWSYDNLVERYALFKQLLEEDGVEYEGQNLMYDATMLDQIGIRIRRVTYDTMIASHILYPEFPKGLNFINSIYTDIPYYKDEGKSWKEAKDGRNRLLFYTYNGKDVCSTTESAIRQKEELTERGLWDCFNRKMDIFQPCREATFTGIRVDLDMLRQFIKDTEAKREKYQAELNEVAGVEVNVSSPKQIAKLLYETRGIAPRYKDKKVTTDAKALSDIAAKTGDRACGLIVLVRQSRKLLSNYFNENIVSRDQRIRYNLNLVGTRFGRLSSDAPLWGLGLNIQNIPLESRRFYIADDGMEIAEFDQVQAEAVITAYLADDPVHIDCFRHGKDVHRVTACLLMDMDTGQWKEIPKQSMIRELAKKCNHGLNYGMGWGTFMAIVNKEYDPDDPNSLSLTAAEAKRIHAKYLNIRPALNNYWQGIEHELKYNQRTLVSPLGFPYQFLEQWSNSLLLAGYSFKPQSTVGEQTNIAIARVFKDPEMRRLGVRFTAQVHDSIMYQWPKENRAEIMSRIFPLLETEVYINGYRVVVPWEGKAGQSWYKPEMEALGQSRVCCEVGYE